MTKLRILGACAGTEPMPDHQHTSLVLSAGDRVYFFDAGESCARSAHLAGIDLLKTRAIFISHTHFDHIGGLAGLFWHIRKLSTRKNAPVADGALRLFIPQLECWDSILSTLRYTEDQFQCSFSIAADTPQTGVFYEDENLRVLGYRTDHMPDTNGLCRAFAYRIELPDRSIVFSGDTKTVDMMEAPVGSGCDLLLMETGHHAVRDVCRFAQTHPVGQLIFIHHGREILEGKASVQEALDACDHDPIIAWDGMELSW